MTAAHPISSLDDLRARLRQLPAADAAAAAAAAARQAELTKPPGALGRLEELALWLAAWQGREPPRLERVAALVFAGNHGVAARGVSAYPSAVTAQMVANFEAGRRGDQPALPDRRGRARRDRRSSSTGRPRISAPARR